MNRAEEDTSGRAISGGAALISSIVKGSSTMGDGLTEWLTGISGDGAGHDITLHRTVIAAISNDNGSK